MLAGSFIENLSQTDYPAFIRTFELERVIEAIKDNEKQNLNTSLSGGEKQELAFIYMLSKNADVLILDEPTSALDTKSVEKIKEVLLEIKENKIVILNHAKVNAHLILVRSKHARLIVLAKYVAHGPTPCLNRIRKENATRKFPPFALH
ncbi:ATP-binding cassette domain-containing protein [Paenibacillus dendritiformis]|uniref:ATP-binding cassette domain-containing protein n=1 Tax=Paenibacillus dendritiformis TaxID=130049 RepID=UPI00365F7C8C